MASTSSSVNLERLMKELGPFKKFHLCNYLMVGLVIYSVAFYNIDYVFLAADVPYRCMVTACESRNATVFKPTWWQHASPAAGALEARCYHRSLLSDKLSCDEATSFSEHLQACNAWIYASNNTVVAEFNLACQEWKRTLVGTIHNFSMLVSLPILGYISDNFGRKRALILACSLCGVIGTLKAFSVSYEMYVIVEFLETVAGASAFPAAYIFLIELVGEKNRVKATAFISTIVVLGGISFALTAKTFQYWRTFILVVYPPSILFLLYIHFLPESIRWLLSKERKEKAVEIIMSAAKMNKVILSDDTMKELSAEKPTTGEEEMCESKLMQVLKSSIIMTRLAICSWWWITCTFVFYGLAINSVSLAGDKYTNYMLVVSVELIAVTLNILLLDRIGRKKTLRIAFTICGLSNIAQPFISRELPWLVTLLYLVGKITITQAFGGVYMYTSELFPTSARHSLLALCSMLGRVGSIVAPQMPLLTLYVAWLPSVLFGAAALLAGALMLLTPETLHAALPDDVRGAEALAARGAGSPASTAANPGAEPHIETSRC